MLAASVLTSLVWALYLSDIGPNETQVLLAAIGAFSSTLTALLIGRERRDRRRDQGAAIAAAKRGGLVAVVPEHVMRDVEAAQPPAPAPQEPSA